MILGPFLFLRLFDLRRGFYRIPLLNYSHFPARPIKNQAFEKIIIRFAECLRRTIFLEEDV